MMVTKRIPRELKLRNDKSPEVRNKRKKNWEAFIKNEAEAREEIETLMRAGIGASNISKARNFHYANLSKWLNHPDRKEWWDEMKALRAESLVDQSLEVLKESERDADGNLTNPGVNLVKIQSETMRWLAGKIDKKTWGEEKQAVSLTIDLKGPFAERLAYRQSFLERVDQEQEITLIENDSAD